MYSQTAIMYYSKPEIQKAILKFAKNRELGSCFDGFYGKRPDMIEYISDIKSLVQKKIFSFHFSEERWANPLLLGNKNLSAEDVANNRIGWDLILDLDGIDYLYAQIVGDVIIKYLTKIGIHNVSVKFSGNKGFHIGIPFESFSTYVGLEETSRMFPEYPKKIATYLMFKLKNEITKRIIEHEGSVENIAKKHNLQIGDLMTYNNGKKEFDYLKVIEVDTILLASRHLFRAPYSLHEKSEKVSIPIDKTRILEFKKEEAIPSNVNPKNYENFEFLKYDPKYGKDGDILLAKALDADVNIEDLGVDPYALSLANKGFKQKRRAHQGKVFSDSDIEYSTFDIQEDVDRSEFPKTIHYILENQFPDGKKRALFVLLTFLHAINWQKENIEKLIEEWNKLQEDSLKDNYVLAQLSWFDAQDKKISTPLFTNDNYYKSIGVPDKTIKEDINKYRIKSKSPLHLIALYVEERKKQPKKKTKKEEKKNE